MTAFNVVAVVLLLAASATLAQDDFLYGTFPNGFLWGAATSAYQIEGAWNLSGKGVNIWDTRSHADPCVIKNCDTGDVAADSYHLYNLDIAALKETGVAYYRFSLSWTRILPTGRNDFINPDGISYYNGLIDALILQGITPVVTIYHWDLPQVFQDEFLGFLDEQIVQVYADFATVVFNAFGDRVKHWITFNEAFVICQLGYGVGSFAPGLVGSGTNDYICGHNLLKAHATAWHIYDDNFRATQNGEVGITLDCHWFEPKTQNQSDIDAAERAMQFKLGWFAHPIYSTDGDYPPAMKDNIARHSAEEGYPQSRLPEFDAAWIAYIKGSSDFFGINHYSTALCEHADVVGTPPNYDNDMNVQQSQDPSWPGSAADWFKVVPWGFRKLLNWIKNNYANVRVIVTENGYASLDNDLNDTARVDYYTGYINEMMKAVNVDGCNVFAYTAWSIIDNMEWSEGYTHKYGLYQVDYSDPALPRTRKDSGKLYSQIIVDNGFPPPAK